MNKSKTHVRIPSSSGSGPVRQPSARPEAPGPDQGDSDPEHIGRIIDGRYRILQLIGRGGMGSVYKAEHVGIRRIVALKLLHSSLAQLPEVARRFEREAFAIGRIEHPNCVNVSDFGRLEDGSLYLVLEYLEGHSLGDELAETTRIEPHRALRILRHVLRGLGHAHDNEIVHRDVKPENVLLVPQEGDPDFAKILDFGIAKLIGSAAEDDGNLRLTQAGMAFGTPIYMSPEQAVGNPVDGRADLYAASVMAYEMITGKPPFHSDDKLEVMSMHTSKPVPSMREVAPQVDVDPAIEELIRRGLAKRPKDRYLSATEYIDAIDEVLGDTLDSVPRINPKLKTPGTAPVVYGNASTDRMKVANTAPLATSDSEAETLTTPAVTGETRDAPKKSRWLVLALVMVVLAVLGGAAFMFFAGSRKSLADRAAEKLESGDPRGAIALLEGKQDTIATDAAAQLQLGHAYAVARADDKALKAYRKALELDAGLAQDGTLRANLTVMCDGKSGKIAVAAAEILATQLGDEATRDKLVAFASSHQDLKTRHLAVATIERLGLRDRVDWVESYMLDLVQLEGCKARSEIVPKLRELGDKRAAAALRRAANRRGKSGKYKDKLINRCLRDQALEAADYLDKLGTPDAPVQPGTPAPPPQ